MKKLGIIGGFGPETTAQFQLEVVELCRATGLPNRPEILMWNAPISLKLEEDLIMRNSRIEEFLPFLVDGAKLLEQSGASFIVLPCNTLHIFINEIRKAVRVPVLSIVDITLQHLTNLHVKSVAVISTEATLASNLFLSQLTKANILPIIPSDHEQSGINQVIFDTLNIKGARRATRILRAITNECIQRGAQDILLACTDLQLVFPNIKEARVHDTMHILANACVREIMQKI